MARIVVIGAGVGGLTAAALLLRAGHQVTVLEAQTYPGGSAGTFYHKGYRFDAGATLAGGFGPGQPHARIAELLGLQWPVHPADPAWVVHLAELAVTQWTDRAHWQEERQRAFPGSEGFWKIQERLAQTAWQISSRSFPWPPGQLAEAGQLLGAMRPALLLGAPFALRSVSSLLPRNASPTLRTFLDAQLLISAQTTHRQANALYGSAALDLPRRGVYQIERGIGGLADTLVAWIRQHGGQVLYRQPVNRLLLSRGRVNAVCTSKQLELPADAVIANLTPQALAALLEDAPAAPAKHSKPTWGAFTLYLGLDAAQLPAGMMDHHQIIRNPALPLGEGNSVFFSLSPAGDASRAPQGMRAATLSTHTAVLPWWQALQTDPAEYAARKEAYTQRILQTVEQTLPGLRQAVQLCLPGTPVTFEFYTRRPLGQVGGSAQTSLFHVRGPRTHLPNVWLVGDSIFPGQSTAGVTLGALRTAETVTRALNR